MTYCDDSGMAKPGKPTSHRLPRLQLISRSCGPTTNRFPKGTQDGADSDDTLDAFVVAKRAKFAIIRDMQSFGTCNHSDMQSFGTCNYSGQATIRDMQARHMQSRHMQKTAHAKSMTVCNHGYDSYQTHVGNMMLRTVEERGGPGGPSLWILSS